MYVRNVRHIQAPPDVVWEVLSDPTQWPRWTSSVTSAELLDGATQLGPGHRVRIVQPGLRSAVWTVTEYRAGVSFTWASREGGVSTSATHEVLRRALSRSRLVLELDQSGFLAPVVSLLAGRRVRRYVALEAAGLAAEAEKRAQGVSAA